jgi:hypothetical protein
MTLSKISNYISSAVKDDPSALFGSLCVLYRYHDCMSNLLITMTQDLRILESAIRSMQGPHCDFLLQAYEGDGNCYFVGWDAAYSLYM